VAGSLNNLGVLSWNRGNLDKAAENYKASIAIKEKLSPGSLDLAATLNNLGIISQLRGNLSEAETHYKASLAIKEKLAPDSEDVAFTLNNLGVVAWDRGDLVAAEARYKKAKAVYEKLDPGSPDVAASLNNLGLLAWERGDLERAEAHHKEALVIRRTIAPDSLDVAYSLNNLGLIARAKEDLKGAASLYRESLALRRKLAPESLDTARSMMNLGTLLDDMGDAEEGRAFYREALALAEKIAPENLLAGKTLVNLGLSLEKKGETAEAERLFRKALGLFAKWAPGSTLEAESHYNLGTLLVDGNRLQPARDHLLKAVKALEEQKFKWGGGEEALERFSARYGAYYKDLMEIQLRLDLKDDAFHTLERYRARVLLSMLAERDLDFSRDAPAELLQEQRTVNVQYDKAQDELATLSPGADPGKAKALLDKMMTLQERRREVREKIRKASPGLASLQDPEPLTADQALAMLDPGTLFLSYSVAERQTLLFSLLDGKLKVRRIPVSRRDLEASVRRYRALLSDPASPMDELVSRSRKLFDLLLKPAEKEVRKGRRILLAPDGPLHILPFSTLRTGSNRYLVELKPLTQTSSATVYMELKRKEKPAPGTLAAFGDPLYPGASPAAEDRAVRAGAGRGDFSPLPFTRKEVEALRGLFPERVRVFIGVEASEEALKRLPAGTSIVHIAAHAFVDERFPLDSGLVMTIPAMPSEGAENGILQAWEIFEQIRMNADLVTLSACQTGLGKEMGGEGLIGLTRAFQYAGAHAVLSTLWSVADESTAQFMKTFYGHLKAGKSKAEALRLAQLSFIHHPATASAGYRLPAAALSHPLHWAPFVLNGH
jgi:CHAT domain-containing protein/Tfp pilus assembly protein PilF